MLLFVRFGYFFSMVWYIIIFFCSINQCSSIFVMTKVVEKCITPKTEEKTNYLPNPQILSHDKVMHQK